MKYDPKTSIGYWSAKAHRTIFNLQKQEFTRAGHNVSGEQWTALVFLCAGDGLTINDLASGLEREQTSTTRLVETMVKHNLVKRCEDPDDRRARRIYVTDKGRSAEKELTSIAQSVIKKATAGITEEEYSSCLSTLSKIVLNFA